MIPIEWKAVQRDHIEMIERAKILHTLNKFRIDRRNAAEDTKQMRIDFGDCVRRGDRHF